MFNLQVQLKILAASKTQNLINDPVRSNVKTEAKKDANKFHWAKNFEYSVNLLYIK